MKKGFTLVEMLAVIVVLSLVMVISIRSISAVRKTQLEKVNNEKIANIEKAAVLYGQEHPEVFNDALKCSNYNEADIPGISDYKTYSFCVIINGFELAENKYLDTDTDDTGAVIKNNLTGYNMLNYYIIIYRNNNRVNAYVSQNEPIDDPNYSSKIPVQAYAPQGGAYSTCANGKYKVLIGDVYKCGSKALATASITTIENNNPVKKCSTTSKKLVAGHEDYCCPNNTVYIEGYCVSKLNPSNPICSTNYTLSTNNNLCIYNNPLVESTCSSGYTKKAIASRYLCVNNTDSSIMIAPTCSNGKVLSDDQNYCELGDYTLSRCASGTKRFINNKYQCVRIDNLKEDPTCPTGKLTFRNLYCKTSDS